MVGLIRLASGMALSSWVRHAIVWK